jgi:hypothetical protein
VPDERPDLSLFLDILRTLEAADIPYMIIGAFAATVYGSTRVTYDIDIVVDLDEGHIEALAAAYPPPRYYADPEQVREAVRLGIMFNIIDSSRGEKADLLPLSAVARRAVPFGYRQAFERRVRQTVEVPGAEPFEVWCARPEDVIVGKLMAWSEGRSRKHETDIFEMLVFHYLAAESGLDERYVDAGAVPAWARRSSGCGRLPKRPPDERPAKGARHRTGNNYRAPGAVNAASRR